ncbi:MAG: cytochrome c maturation protein CcmE [Saprospiraceae bacterium]|nr:cytochrome c maturation protein CcmE [Saprospiraceae bacterium]
MKKFQIVALIAIIAAVYILVTASKEVSTYATFEMAQDGNRVKITGTMAKNKAMEYRPDIDPNIFKFFLKDSEGIEKQVVLAKAKPQDIERAESIVLTGSLKDNVFYADEILTKCPSKYKNEELSLKEGVKS